MTTMFEFVKKQVKGDKENNQPDQPSTSLREELLKPEDQPPQ